MKGEKIIFFNTSSQATVSFIPAGSDDITVTAKDSSIGGDLVSIQVRHDEAAGTVSVSGNAILIGVGGGGDKGADDILGYFNGSAAATALATMTVTGTAHVAADYDSGQLYLAGGEAFVGYPMSSFMGMHPFADGVLRLHFKSMKNHCGSTLRDTKVVSSDYVELNLTTNNTHRELIAELCNLFDSASGGYGDIYIGNDQAGGRSYTSTLISNVGTVNVLAANT
tara:strand:- start:905 stop:1576 length:672 start_codon:yes stop_codon:yes gene_type:complete